MGWSDVRYCFAMTILVTTLRLLSGILRFFFAILIILAVQRVTCYDHFCVFQFFSILAVSMATAAILKKSTINSTTSHGI
jgi:hypothetical protein